MSESSSQSPDAVVPDWVKALIAWYHNNRREMPWRENPTPYRVWISEIMLQQTQVETVRPYFDQFMARFPDVKALAGADQEDVLKAWEGLGYYSRARNLHRAAQRLVGEATFPGTYDELLQLPGVGPYTAAAIASIAFGLPHAVLDGNVLRVFSRFWAVNADISRGATRKRIQKPLQEAILQSGAPSAFNQAMMELGALVCRPKRPSCAECPLGKTCLAAQSGQAEAFPVRKKRPAVPHYKIAVALVRHHDRILIARREDHKMLGGLWEFPGGKVESGETSAEAVRREVLEETGLEVVTAGEVCTVEHAYSHFSITVTAFWCDLVDGSETVSSARPMRWVALAELVDYPFPKANHKIFAKMGLPGKTSER